MKIPSAVNKVLTNRWALNAVALLALFNVIGYAVLGKFQVVVYFVVLAVLVRFFTRNMMIVLGVPLLLVNLMVAKGTVEGMTTGTTKQDAVVAKKKTSNANRPDPKTRQGLPMKPIAREVAGEEDTSSSTEEEGGQQGFEPGRSKNKSYDIDYATTVEEAYDELNNLLGSDGIQKLTSDTQHLMEQQMQLAKAMESMTPMMKSLAPMVENLKGMMGDNNINEMMSLAKKFTK